MFTVANARTGEEYGTSFTHGTALALEGMLLRCNPELELVIVVRGREG